MEPSSELVAEVKKYELEIDLLSEGGRERVRGVFPCLYDVLLSIGNLESVSGIDNGDGCLEVIFEFNNGKIWYTKPRGERDSKEICRPSGLYVGDSIMCDFKYPKRYLGIWGSTDFVIVTIYEQKGNGYRKKVSDKIPISILRCI